MSGDLIHIACAADAAYVPHAAAMLYSLKCNAQREQYCVHFLHAALPQDLMEKLEAFVSGPTIKIHYHEIPSKSVAGLPEMGRISSVMWYRILLPELLPGIKRIIYMDCDTIVMGSIADLWRADLDGNWLGAVSNVFEAGQEEQGRRLGLSGSTQYFNSGVLLMDLDAWRREGCTRQILDLARDPAVKLLWPDQDALNRVFAHHWMRLHPRWNCQNSFFFFRHAGQILGDGELASAISRPGILHFEGGELAKPWHYLCKNPFRGEYLRCRDATPWPIRELEGDTLLNRLMRPLPMSVLLPTLRIMHRTRNALARRRSILSNRR
jgi:lipopolysaccharide biosynthesis glycosyltransferase